MILELCCLCCPALLSMPRPVGADGAALHHLFVPTKNVTDSHWTSAFKRSEPAASLLRCASQCVKYSSCNAFLWNTNELPHTCNLAQLTQLEDTEQGSSSSAQESNPIPVMVSVNAVASLTRHCNNGGEHCCHLHGGNLCSEGEGDCNDDRECEGFLECGQDNCITEYSKEGGLWDPADDCCRPRCSYERPCGQGEGPCASNDHSQCQAPGNEAGSSGGMLCDVECTNRSWFQVERFPNNSESQGYTSHRCCRRRCADHSPCADGEWGCERNWECQAGLECIMHTGKELGQCVDIDECTDPRFIDASLAYCGQNTTCTNSIGSFSCPCNPGFTGFQGGVGCHDLDECSYYSNSGQYCGSNNAGCINIVGWSLAPSQFSCGPCNEGYTAWSANSGCRDRNECDYGSHAENTHNCVRSSNNGICMNNAGSFSCGSCSTSGTRRYGSSGTVKSDGYPWGYSKNTNKQWYIEVPANYHPQIKITNFYTESCCDKLYITWDVCAYGFWGYYTYYRGTPSTPITLEGPKGKPGVNLKFVSDYGVQYMGWKLTWTAIPD